MPRKAKLTKRELTAWREARIQNYMHTRSLETLAQMVVELEDSGGHTAEFEFDDTWPQIVRHLKPGVCPVCQDGACETKSLECGK